MLWGEAGNSTDFLKCEPFYLLVLLSQTASGVTLNIFRVRYRYSGSGIGQGQLRAGVGSRLAARCASYKLKL